MKLYFLALLTAVIATSSPAASSKPNVVLIMADDLGFAELGSYGQEKIKTPNLDKLAADGQRWTNYYCGSPVCSPSRNVLLTGRHGGGCAIQDLKRAGKDAGNGTGEKMAGDWPIPLDTHMLHGAMKAVGYSTALFGKWGLGEFGTTGAPDKHGIDTFYGYTDQAVCHTFYPQFLWRNGEKEIINEPGIPGHAKQPEGVVDDAKYTGQKHASKLIIAEAVKFIDARAEDKKPFLLYYAPTEPHVAMQPPQEWVDQYPKDWDTEPYRGQNGYLPHSRPHAAYAATISFLDYNVGLLLAELKSKGLEENTLVIFTSDNGTTHDVGGVDHEFFNSVKDLKGLKGSAHEGGIRVPAIVRWPGKVPAGTVTDQPGYHADIMPSLCALTGADAGKPYGTNVSPVWLGEKKTLENRNPMVWCTGGYGGQVAVRLGDMKAYRAGLFPSNARGPQNWEVYDLVKDRGETTDLAASRGDVIEKALEVLKKEYSVAPGFRELAIFAPDNKGSEADNKPVEKTAKPWPYESVFKSLEADKDGKLSFTEWKLSPKAKSNPTKHDEIFADIDKNSDAFLSLEEFKNQGKKN